MFLEEIARHPRLVGLATLLTIIAGTWTILTQIVPTVTGEIGPLAVSTLVAALAIGAIVLGLVLLAFLVWQTRPHRYRVALKKVTRDYIVDVADLNTRLDPEHYGPMSDGVKRGEESADREWGDRIYRKYGLPTEDEYR
jgi:hypothetical protein